MRHRSCSQNTYSPHTDLPLLPAFPLVGSVSFSVLQSQILLVVSAATTPTFFPPFYVRQGKLTPFPAAAVNTDTSEPNRVTLCLWASGRFRIPGLSQLVLDAPLGRADGPSRHSQKERKYCSYFEERCFLPPPGLEQVLPAATL